MTSPVTTRTRRRKQRADISRVKRELSWERAVGLLGGLTATVGYYDQLLSEKS